MGIIGLLIVFNNFQIQQYYRNAIHYWWMNKDAYWETFLKLHPTERYDQLITLPDYDKARQGIYVEIKPENKKIIPSKVEVIEFISSELRQDSLLLTQLSKQKASTSSIDSLLLIESKKIYSIDSFGYYKKMVLSNLEEDIRNNKILMEYIATKAEKNKISIDSMVTLDAIWLYNKKGY